MTQNGILIVYVASAACHTALSHTHKHREWERGREEAKPPHWNGSQSATAQPLGGLHTTHSAHLNPPTQYPPHCPPQHPSRVSVRSDCALTLKLMLHIFSFSVYSPFFRWVSLALSSAPPHTVALLLFCIHRLKSEMFSMHSTLVGHVGFLLAYESFVK